MLAEALPLCGEPPGLPHSVWQLTAQALPPLPPLQGDADTDVLVIGAGFCGLAAAISLAEHGVRVTVIDAFEPGWGASGRNNGQVIPGLKLDPAEVVAVFGADTGERLIAWGGAAPDAVFDLIERYKIDCHAVRAGWIQPAYTRHGAARMEARCAQWEARGAPVRMLPPAELPTLLGTGDYVAAWIDRRGGTLNPLGFARGLAAAAIAAGARVHAQTRAVSLERDAGRWVVRTPSGRICAQRVFVATAAYAEDMVPGLRRSFVPVRTAQTASAPLNAAQARAILPGRQGASDTRRLLTSFRLSPDGRLVMGGSGATGGVGHAHLLPRLRRVGEHLFRELGSIRWEFGWSGYFAVTMDHLPHLHASDDGLICALGCNGRGIAVSTALGGLVARRLLDASVPEDAIRPSPMRAVRFHAFRHVGIAVAAAVNGLQDRFDRARTPAQTVPDR